MLLTSERHVRICKEAMLLYFSAARLMPVHQSLQNYQYDKSEVLTAVLPKIQVFRDVTLCQQRFRTLYWLHLRFLDPEDEDTILFRNVAHYLPAGMI
jgi:ligand-binding SRPBCC domain-containing protein